MGTYFLVLSIPSKKYCIRAKDYHPLLYTGLYNLVFEKILPIRDSETSIVTLKLRILQEVLPTYRHISCRRKPSSEESLKEPNEYFF